MSHDRLKAYRYGASWIIWCRYCRYYHTHGNPGGPGADGFREALCIDRPYESPYRRNQYELVDAGPIPDWMVKDYNRQRPHGPAPGEELA